MTTTCPACLTVHEYSATTALGRFNPSGPSGYQYRGGPVRATRAEAEADMCQARVMQRMEEAS